MQLNESSCVNHIFETENAKAFMFLSFFTSIISEILYHFSFLIFGFLFQKTCVEFRNEYTN